MSISSSVLTGATKLSGYDTLRLVLSKKSILVEGDSDELVVQKSYMDTHDGRLPIEDGIDVISVGTSFLRFLAIADKLHKRVAVITDNDGSIKALEKKYQGYLNNNAKDNILISFDKSNHTPSNSGVLIKDYNYNTLENLLLHSNDRIVLNSIFVKKYDSDDNLRVHMKNNKTECALAIFESTTKIAYPSYITKAIAHVCQ